MKIVEIRLYKVRSGNTGERGSRVRRVPILGRRLADPRTDRKPHVGLSEVCAAPLALDGSGAGSLCHRDS